MAETPREAWITGIGILSCLGEGPEAHWQALNGDLPQTDAQTFAPFVVHPIAPVDFDKQIPKKGDQRQMEAWQRIGTYAAGLALDSAGLKGNAELLTRTDMIVAAGGGERDTNVDSAILTGVRTAENPAAFVNERLMNDLRPTLFLAQLSNLLAGNISIVHGVTGSSRTFMGEESAGVDAARIAVSRILAGQGEISLVGSAFNGERRDLMLQHEFGGSMLKGNYQPVWERQSNPGIAFGSLGAFLVIEERAHAIARGIKPLARLRSIASVRSRRKPGEITAGLQEMWNGLKSHVDTAHCIALSGATGVEPATSEERAFFADHPGLAVRATGSYLGHAPEPQFLMNLALATLILNHGKLHPPRDASGVERATDATVRQVLVTSVGTWRGEGMALVESVS
ncbi:MAG TPA: beta-ketoacyl-ACP synthase [Xanthobacteraceae bacterium]|jgi:3-oxoacyl-[acyl-carrier-protein] synthase II|nr:beta-ketoacyl-ACP synthase [Xanthobacteraceae bacterium]